MTESLTSIWNRIKSYPQLGLVILAFIAFIALGMPDGLLGVAWPGIQSSFSISLDSVGWLLTTTVVGYLTSSFLSGPLIARLGVGHVLAMSCALTGAGLVGYTLVPAWWMMALLGVVTGLGAGAIDAGLNTYVAAHFGAGLMQWLHACYGLGVTLGPIIMTAALARFDSWRVGYGVVGGVQFALAVCFALTLGMWERDDGTGETDESAAEKDRPRRLTEYNTPLGETLREMSVWWSGLLFFLAVCAEGTLGTWTYTLLVESRGIAPEAAGLCVGGYWAMFTAGRVVAGVVAKRLGVDRLVIGSLIVALAGAALFWWNPTRGANLIAVAVIGFAIAPLFPALMSGTSGRVEVHFAANTIGVQIAATGLGLAIVPSLVGVLADRVSLEVVPGCLMGLFVGALGVYVGVGRSGVKR